MRKVVWLALLCLASLAFGAGGAWGVTIIVDDPACPGLPYCYTLQDALNEAGYGELENIILVAPGTYVGNFYYASSHMLNLMAMEGADPTLTILDGNDSGTVLKLYGNMGSGDVQVEGFTIKNGNATTEYNAYGGGVYASDSHVILQNNIITGNVADYGGGVASDSPVLLQNNIITDNWAIDNGGGVFAYSASSSGTGGIVNLFNNTITLNYAGQYGGGVYALLQADSGGTAGDVILVNNIIANNVTDYGGGGVVVRSDLVTGTPGSINLTNNTITGNIASSGSGGGAHLTVPVGSLNFYNNICWGNTASGAEDIYLTGAGTVYGYNNDYHDLSGSWNGGSNGNIDADPLLVDLANGNYHLQPTSPCINAGNNSAPELLPYDFEDDPRIIGSAPDIGADESKFVSHCVNDATGLQKALIAAQSNGMNDPIMVVQGTYTGNFTYDASEGFSITLEGGYTTGCASREVNPTNTVLKGGGAGSGSVLHLANSAGGSIFVEGFTIQGGHTLKDGGGVYASTYSASGTGGNITLTNNTITGNTSTGGSGGGVYAAVESGVGIAGEGNITFTNNIITENGATDVSAGVNGGVCSYAYSASGTAGNVTFTNNIIAGNNASVGIGGVSADSYSASGTAGTVTFTNNTITGNTASDYAGGLYLYKNGNTINCYNNIIWGNTSPNGGDISLNGATGTFNGYYNDYSDMYGSWTSEDGNIDDNPLFVGGGDYHLRSASPCIDRGNAGAPQLPATDFEGDPRIIRSAPDMGADEVASINYVILHQDGALWSSATGWITTTPPYYPGTAYARALQVREDNSYVILHKDGAIYDSATGWLVTTPPYYPGSNYAVDLKVTGSGEEIILHRDGALWSSSEGWTLTAPPYYPGTAYAKALQVRTDNSYAILHKDGAIYDSASGWITTSPPYYPGTAWAVDMKLEDGGYVILHRDGAIWSTSEGWIMTAPPYYPTTDYARALELVGDGYKILHKDGAIYDSVDGWNVDTPPYYPGTGYAVDLEVQ